MVSTKLSVILVSLVLIAGLGMYIFSLQDDSLTGATITATSGRQCEDTDNNRPSTGPRAEQEGTDSIWARGGVKTRVNSRAGFSSIDYDSCASSTLLREKYCDSSGMKINEDVTCDYGCSTGRCNIPICSDPDGENYAIRSTTTGFLNTYRPLGVPPDQTAQSYTDTCISTSTLKEYKCVGGRSVREKIKACSEVGSGFTCRDGMCAVPLPRPTTETICDGLDDNSNGIIDEGCDDDNDDYCDSSMTRSSSYSCSGSTNCCSLGGGDCSDYSGGFGGNRTNPGAQEDCFLYIDENCNGQRNENCSPYTCEDTDPSNDPYVGGNVMYTAANGQVLNYVDYSPPPYFYRVYFADRCAYRNVDLINQTSCFTISSSFTTEISPNLLSDRSNIQSTCPSGTTCSDPDGTNGPTPAVCQ